MKEDKKIITPIKLTKDYDLKEENKKKMEDFIKSISKKSK